MIVIKEENKYRRDQKRKKTDGQTPFNRTHWLVGHSGKKKQRGGEGHSEQLKQLFA